MFKFSEVNLWTSVLHMLRPSVINLTPKWRFEPKKHFFSHIFIQTTPWRVSWSLHVFNSLPSIKLAEPLENLSLWQSVTFLSLQTWKQFCAGASKNYLRTAAPVNIPFFLNFFHCDSNSRIAFAPLHILAASKRGCDSDTWCASLFTTPIQILHPRNTSGIWSMAQQVVSLLHRHTL